MLRVNLLERFYGDILVVGQKAPLEMIVHAVDAITSACLSHEQTVYLYSVDGTARVVVVAAVLLARMYLLGADEAISRITRTHTHRLGLAATWILLSCLSCSPSPGESHKGWTGVYALCDVPFSEVFAVYCVYPS